MTTTYLGEFDYRHYYLIMTGKEFRIGCSKSYQTNPKTLVSISVETIRRRDNWQQRDAYVLALKVANKVLVLC